MRITLLKIILLAAVSAVSPAHADDSKFPSKYIKVIVPFPPSNGGTDLIPRAINPRFQAATGQSLMIENKPGAGGVVAINSFLAAPADGYTLMLASSAHLAQNPHLFLSARYDPIKDFESVVLVGSTQNILFVGMDSPIKSLDDLLATAKTTELSYGSAGTGLTAHLAVEMLRQQTNAKLRHIPYKGSALMMTDVIAKHLHLGTVSIPAATPLIKAGKLRAIAVTGDKRDPNMPNVPALSERFPGMVAVGWYGLAAPAGTPKPVLARLNSVLSKIVATPEFRDEMAANGITTMSGTLPEIAAFRKTEVERWGTIIRAAGIEKQ